MASKFFEKAIVNALEKKAKEIEGKERVNAKYDITTTARGDQVATATVKLSKPVSEHLIDTSSLLSDVSDALQTENLGIFDALLDRAGISRRKVGKKRTSGNVTVNTGAVDQKEVSDSGAIRGAGGSFISNTNLRSMLELAAKKYLIKDMKRPNAPLKHQTGRFANSLNITSVNTSELDSTAQNVKTSRGVKGKRKPRVSIFYTYMTYPYATFDPAVSNRPEMYMKPSYGARNPQVHIGEAIAKAARDLMYKGYKIEVNQRK